MTVLDAGRIVLGIVLLVAGGELLVRGATALARRMGLSVLVIGLTVVSLATSAPELTVTVSSVLAGEPGLALGNVVGSCLLNLGLVLEVPAILVDGGLPVPAAAVALDIPVMLAAVVALLPIAFTGFAVARWEGGLFLVLYLAYTGYVLLAATEHDALEGFSSVMVSFVLPLVVMTLGAVSAHELGRRRERRGPGGRPLATMGGPADGHGQPVRSPLTPLPRSTAPMTTSTTAITQEPLAVIHPFAAASTEAARSPRTMRSSTGAATAALETPVNSRSASTWCATDAVAVAIAAAPETTSTAFFGFTVTSRKATARVFEGVIVSTAVIHRAGCDRSRDRLRHCLTPSSSSVPPSTTRRTPTQGAGSSRGRVVSRTSTVRAATTAIPAIQPDRNAVTAPRVPPVTSISTITATGREAASSPTAIGRPAAAAAGTTTSWERVPVTGPLTSGAAVEPTAPLDEGWGPGYRGLRTLRRAHRPRGTSFSTRVEVAGAAADHPPRVVVLSAPAMSRAQASIRGQSRWSPKRPPIPRTRTPAQPGS